MNEETKRRMQNLNLLREQIIVAISTHARSSDIASVKLRHDLRIILEERLQTLGLSIGTEIPKSSTERGGAFQVFYEVAAEIVRLYPEPDAGVERAELFASLLDWLTNDLTDRFHRALIKKSHHKADVLGTVLTSTASQEK